MRKYFIYCCYKNLAEDLKNIQMKYYSSKCWQGLNNNSIHLILYAQYAKHIIFDETQHIIFNWDPICIYYTWWFWPKDEPMRTYIYGYIYIYIWVYIFWPLILYCLLQIFGLFLAPSKCLVWSAQAGSQPICFWGSLEPSLKPPTALLGYWSARTRIT